ncbi:MAG: nuclear transport factor 2 family protein [Aldersonia sp.]|nr:nuclear transport factor 2 family protein [Aldersonia sp.]
MIDEAIKRWHSFVRTGAPADLDAALAEDVVFYSPIVYTPQAGKDITTMYLMAARQTLAGGGADGAFRYTKQVLAGDVAVLEFETTIDDKYVNGVDIIRCDDSGRIVEFRVMLRPLQAVNIVHEQMRAMLESMQS